MNLNKRFCKELARCTDPTVFLGVARILAVKLVGEEKDEKNHFVARPTEDILCDVVQNFYEAPRTRKRELLKIFRKANEEVFVKADTGEDKNDIRTENSEGQV